MMARSADAFRRAALLSGRAARSLLTLGRGPLAAAALFFCLAFFFGPPHPRFPGGLSTALYDREGALLGASVSSQGLWKFPAGSKVPHKFERALIAFEDRRFYSHPGIDPRSLARAAAQNAREGRIVSGGSTLSMQTARLALPGGSRSLPRKLMEAWLALRLEVLYGKPGILELYSANAPFGGNVVGLEAASFRYFGLPPDRLSWAEAATLAVLPNAPSVAHPGKNRDELLAKRDRLLRSLVRSGDLSEEELGLSLAEPLPPEPFAIPRLAPQLLDRALLDSRSAGKEGERVVSSVDGGLEERTAEILERHHLDLAGNGIYNEACIVARVDSGEVLAYVGNVGARDPEDHGQSVDLTRAPRSSGSILKPFLYAAMLDSGEITSESLVADIPTRVGSYNPENNVDAYSGAVPAKEALARSLNVPFVRLLRSFGSERFLRLLQKTGVTTMDRDADDYGLTLILGGAEVSLWEMAGRYAALARTARGLKSPDGGQYFDLSYRLPQSGSGGGAERASRRVSRGDPFSTGAAWLTLDALLAVARPADEAPWQDYASARKIAWKTGTSFGLRDAWAIGLTSEYVVAVWVGNASGEGRPGLRGSEAAAPILFDVFASLPVTPWIPRPDKALRYESLCAASGFLAGPDCASSRRSLVPLDAPAAAVCPYCRLVHLSADGAYRVTASDEALDKMRTVRRFVLPPAMEWYYMQNHLEYSPLPPWKPGSASRDDSALAIVAPEEGASIYVPIELSGRPGATVFSAVHRDPGAVVYWHLDGSYLGQTKGRHRMEARPAAGPHRLTLVDGEGREVERQFEVLSER